LSVKGRQSAAPSSFHGPSNALNRLSAKRYAHLAPAHLAAAVERIVPGTKATNPAPAATDVAAVELRPNFNAAAASPAGVL
jgi:hypothetical protein